MPTGNQDNSADRDAPDESPRVEFEELAKGNREVVIEYEGQDYRLRVTRNGKLILNK